MKKNIPTLAIIGIGILLFSLTIGVVGLVDSYFYINLGWYFYSGHTDPINPYNLTKPQTLFGPVYGLIIAPLQKNPLPIAIVAIPFFQISILFVSAYLIYLILKTLLRKPYPLLGAMIFFLLPFNLIYATFIMAETLTEFFVALYAYLLFRILNKSKGAHPSQLVLVAALATLTRNAMVPLLVVALIHWITTVPRDIRHVSRPSNTIKIALSHIPAVIGIAVLALWMLFNYRLVGKFELSTHTGRHLYNNVVDTGHFLPAPGNPTLAPFLKRIPESDMFQPWWNAMLIFNDGIIPETKVDKMMFDVSIAAILHQPLAYTAHVANMAIETPKTPPLHPDNLASNYFACANDTCTKCVDEPWHYCWDRNICEPLVKICPVQTAWASWITGSTALYPWISLIIFAIGLVGCVFACIKGPTFFRWVAGLFIILHLFQSSTEWIEGRFIIPLYPLYAILIVVGVQHVVSLIRLFRVRGEHH